MEMSRMVTGFILALVGIILVTTIFGETGTDISDGLTNATNSGLKLSDTLFDPSGIGGILVTVGVFIGVLGLILGISGAIRQ